MRPVTAMAARAAATLLIVVASALLHPAAAQSATPGTVRAAVTRAIRAVAADMRLGVDTSVVDDMTASATIFAGNFCSAAAGQAGAADARCQATIFRDGVLRRHVQGFLADAESGASEITPLGARLAREIGSDFAQIGWPSLVPNQLGMVVLPAGLSPAQVQLETATGRVEIASAADRLLMGGGRHLLRLRGADGSTLAAAVSVQPRRRVAFSGTADAAQAGPTGRLDAPPELFCYEHGGLRPEGPLAYFNWGRSRLADSGDAHTAPMARQYGVDIQVQDDASTCDRHCLQALGVVFAQSLAVWRTGCMRCDPNALSVLRVGSLVWIDARIASRLRHGSVDGTVALDLRQRRPDEAGRTVSAPSLSVPLSPVVGYEQLSSDTALRSAACGLADSAAPWVATARHLACGGRPPAMPVVAPLVRLTGGSTPCGPAKDFLACGLPAAGIELAVGSTRFLLPSSRGDIAVGHSSDGLEVSMRDVVMHEVGHWFGVPHFDGGAPGQAADIMASTLGDGRACVSAASLTMMNNAMDTRWHWRVSEGRGLRRPRPAPLSNSVQPAPPRLR